MQAKEEVALEKINVNELLSGQHLNPRAVLYSPGEEGSCDGGTKESGCFICFLKETIFGSE
jgi:hypothetical protein